MKAFGISVVLVSSALVAGVYIVPQEYDNMVLSTKSKSYGVITQATADMSNNSYTIGDKSVKFRCLKVPKLSCTAATPQINANISEVSLKRPSSEDLMTTFQTDLRIEEDATNWYLCGGGYGGQVYDDSTLTSTNASGNTILNYKYVPNSKAEEYWYFTDQANASTKSYMSITYSQVCQ